MELLDISDVAPSTYNPRVADPERLDIIELSLNKLGFVLPIYATKKGEIISGHQRHYVSKRMGLEKVPVEYVKEMDLNMRKNVNIIFNKGTNDAPRLLNGDKLKEKIDSINIIENADKIRDRDRNNPQEMYPCMFPEEVKTKELIKINADKFDEYYKQKTKLLNRYAPQMPIIVDQEHNVINGIGRLHFMASLAKTPETTNVIVLPDDIKDFAYYMLNYLTMDFNIHNKYKDELRFNSYKRSIAKHYGIGVGYMIKVAENPHSIGATFTDEIIAKFKREYGDYILDFGAGHLRNAEILNNNSIECVPFEPFVIDPDKFETLSFERSYNVCNNFLDRFRERDNFSTIFLHAIFNSVPFEEDRKKILTILSAIATPKTKVIIWTRHINAYNSMINDALNKRVNSSSRNSEVLDYEDNVVIADLEKRPKVQKFYDEKGLIKLCNPYFKLIRTVPKSGYIYCECTKPIKQPEEKLMEALDFEFNLKHPDGRTLGLNEKAKKIFKEVLERR